MNRGQKAVAAATALHKASPKIHSSLNVNQKKMQDHRFTRLWSGSSALFHELPRGESTS
jgi:hypothetical protein